MKLHWCFSSNELQNVGEKPKNEAPEPLSIYYTSMLKYVIIKNFKSKYKFILKNACLHQFICSSKKFSEIFFAPLHS